MIFNESLENIGQKVLSSVLLPWRDRQVSAREFRKVPLFEVSFSKVGEKMGICVLLLLCD